MISPNIFQYINYRLFLKDYVDENKNKKSFSLREFSRRAGISTSNYLTRVIKEERNLGNKQTERFIAALGLNKLEAHYFRQLLLFDQTDETEAKLSHLSQIEKIQKRQRKEASRTTNPASSFFKYWFIPIIYELATCKDFKLTSQNVRKALKNRISLSESGMAIDYLLENRILEERDGRYIQRFERISSNELTTKLYLRNANKRMLEFAGAAIDYPFEERSFQGAYLAISKEKMPKVKRKIVKLLNEVIEEFKEDENADSVYRFSVNCFEIAGAKN